MDNVIEVKPQVARAKEYNFSLVLVFIDSKELSIKCRACA